MIEDKTPPRIIAKWFLEWLIDNGYLEDRTLRDCNDMLTQWEKDMIAPEYRSEPEYWEDRSDAPAWDGLPGGPSPIINSGRMQIFASGQSNSYPVSYRFRCMTWAWAWRFGWDYFEDGRSLLLGPIAFHYEEVADHG